LDNGNLEFAPFSKLRIEKLILQFQISGIHIFLKGSHEYWLKKSASSICEKKIKFKDRLECFESNILKGQTKT